MKPIIQEYFEKNWKRIAKISVLVILGLVILFRSISFNNREVVLKNSFTQKEFERTAFYDKMWKIISGKSQVAIRNDSSFYRNVNIIMAARKDQGDNLLMKWITESNPNANYETVAALYQDVSRAIEAERQGFFDREKMMQDIKLQHDNLLTKFPNNILAWIFGKNRLKYTPISSDRTDEVFKTKKDNNDKIFQ